MNQLDPVHFAQLIETIERAANVVVYALGCVAFWIGFTCWENAGK